MAQRATIASTRVLLAVTDDVDRVVLQSDLLRVGYKVRAAPSVEEAINTARLHEHDVLVADLGLAGGGSTALTRQLESDGVVLPFVALHGGGSGRMAAAQSGPSAVVLEAPFHVGQMEAAIERVLTRDRVESNRTLGRSIRGSLSEWTVADLVRYMAYYGFSGRISVSRATAHGMLHFRDGAVTAAELRDTFGERAVIAMLEWSEGLFTLTHAPLESNEERARGPARNVHRSVEDLLVAGLSRHVSVQHELSRLSGLDDVHRFRLEGARHCTRDTSLLGRLREAFDGERTLQEALHAARVETPDEMESVLRMVKSGAITPGTRDEPLDPVIPRDAAGAGPALSSAGVEISPAMGERSRKASSQTVRRKLNFQRKKPAQESPAETFAELEDVVEARRGRDRLRLTWLSLVALVVVILVGWIATRSATSEIPEVRVLDEPTEVRK